MNWTLNVFELNQYLISLLRKMQNNFRSQQSQILADGNFSPKGNYQPNDRSHQTGPWIYLNYISTLFPYWEKCKIHFQSQQSQILANGNFSQKGKLSPTIDHINRTLNIFELHHTLFPYWEKHKIHFSELVVTNFGWWEFFPKRKLSTKW